MAEKQKREFPPFYEKMIPIAIGFLTILTVLALAFAISLIIK